MGGAFLKHPQEHHHDRQTAKARQKPVPTPRVDASDVLFLRCGRHHILQRPEEAIGGSVGQGGCQGLEYGPSYGHRCV